MKHYLLFLFIFFCVKCKRALSKAKNNQYNKQRILHFTLIVETNPSLWSSSSFGRHPLQVTHEQDWGRESILLQSRLLYCPDQMLAVMLLSHHRVSSSRTISPCVSCGSRCMRHAIRTWSAVYLAGPHSHFW